MNDVLDIAASEPKPAFWYGLPYGYQQVHLEPSSGALEEVARQINELPDEARDRANAVFRLYAIIVMMLQRHQVQGCALGIHPDDNGDSSLSVLTVSTMPAHGRNPKVALTQMLADGTGSGSDYGIAPVELPVGVGFLIESERRRVAPAAPPESQEEPLGGTIWHGTVAIPDTRSSSIITVQLVTPSLELADNYRGVLLGVAGTVTFTDPAASVEENHTSGPFMAPGSAAEERSPFG